MADTTKQRVKVTCSEGEFLTEIDVPAWAYEQMRQCVVRYFGDCHTWDELCDANGEDVMVEFLNSIEIVPVEEIESVKFGMLVHHDDGEDCYDEILECYFVGNIPNPDEAYSDKECTKMIDMNCKTLEGVARIKS